MNVVYKGIQWEYSWCGWLDYIFVVTFVDNNTINDMIFIIIIIIIQDLCNDHVEQSQEYWLGSSYSSKLAEKYSDHASCGRDFQ